MNKLDILPEEIREPLIEKITNFKKFIFDIVNENNKELLKNEINNLENNQIKVLIFIMMINKKNKDRHINEFINKFNINEIHNEKINSYIDYFIDVKELFVEKIKN